MRTREGEPLRTFADLTPAERLVIWRRRKGYSQREAALQLHVAPFTLGRMERGELDPPGDEKLGIARDEKLKPNERCYLYRRRTGHTQTQVAEELNVSRIWLNRMERGEAKCDELLWYWEN